MAREKEYFPWVKILLRYMTEVRIGDFRSKQIGEDLCIG